MIQLTLYVLLGTLYSTSVIADGDPLKTINKQFRQHYAQLRDSIQQQSRPVIYQAGSALYLEKSDGSSEKVTAVGPLYHQLKSVSHIPFTLYIMLRPCVDTPLSQELLKDLSGYRRLLLSVKESLASQGFSTEQLIRQHNIVTTSESFLSDVIQNRTVTQPALKKFTRLQADDIKLNFYDVAKSQIDTMHKQLQIWKEQLSPEEWKRLRFVIGASHMPRVGNISLQYFTVLKGQPYDGKYQQETIVDSDFSVIYAEATFKKQDALAVMATHSLDAGAGDYFFNDKQRLHRDILADDAEKIINNLFGK